MTADTLTKDESIRLMQAEIERLRWLIANGRETLERKEQQIQQFNEDWAALRAEIERLRGLLHECLSFALGAPIGWSSDLWERVTETLGSDVRKGQIR